MNKLTAGFKGTHIKKKNTEARNVRIKDGYVNDHFKGPILERGRSWIIWYHGWETEPVSLREVLEYYVRIESIFFFARIF